MKKYAVAVINFFDNDNQVVIVEAKNEITAMAKAANYNYQDYKDYIDWVNEIIANNDTIDEVKISLADGEIGISTPIEI